MNVEILIVTHAKDIDFLRYCLASIAKFASGFSGVTVLVPTHEKELFGWVSPEIGLKHYPEPDGKGMLYHMAMKCRADEWCPNADMILHLDADCILWQPMKPPDYFPGDRPIMVRERYANIKNIARLIWQKNVERALGFKPEYECMVRHPQAHIREVYAKTRQLVEEYTGESFDGFVQSGPNAFPQKFCEWGTVGAVAIAHFAERYHCIDYNPEQDNRECGVSSKGHQFIYRRDRDRICETWSHGGIEKYKSNIEDWLRGRCPAYFIK